jgi:hypothetical protein
MLVALCCWAAWLAYSLRTQQLWPVKGRAVEVISPAGVDAVLFVGLACLASRCFSGPVGLRLNWSNMLFQCTLDACRVRVAEVLSSALKNV